MRTISPLKKRPIYNKIIIEAVQMAALKLFDNCIPFFRYDPVMKSDVHGKCHDLPLREGAVGR